MTSKIHWSVYWKIPLIITVIGISFNVGLDLSAAHRHYKELDEPVTQDELQRLEELRAKTK
jgi:hypothetical protein